MSADIRRKQFEFWYDQCGNGSSFHQSITVWDAAWDAALAATAAPEQEEPEQKKVTKRKLIMLADAYATVCRENFENAAAVNKSREAFKKALRDFNALAATAAPEQAIHKYYPLRHVDGLPCHLCDVAQAAPASSTSGIAQPASQEPVAWAVYFYDPENPTTPVMQPALLNRRDERPDFDGPGFVPCKYVPLYATPQPAEQSADAIRRKAIEDCRNCYSPDISASDWDYAMARLVAVKP